MRRKVAGGLVALAMGSLLAVPLVTVGAGTAQADARAESTDQPHPTTVRLRGPHHFVDETKAVLHVVRTDDTGAPVPGPVSLYVHRRGKSWHLYREVDLGADGTATVTVSPRFDTWWRVHAPASGVYAAAVSNQWALDNRPPGKPWLAPARAPRPQGLPAQSRATTAGAHAVTTRIPDHTWRSMVGRSWHRGCPVGRAGLRLVRVNYWGFDGYRYRGELVVNRRAARKFARAFTDLYDARIPIRAMYLVDRFGWSRRSHGANDFAAMRHDDTSAFNCRWVTGTPGVRSPHSYGFALDLDTWENPYRSRVGLLPDRWWMRHSDPRVAWRSRRHRVVRILVHDGFRWTYGLSDTQHFDAVGRGSRLGRTERPATAD